MQDKGRHGSPFQEAGPSRQVARALARQGRSLPGPGQMLEAQGPGSTWRGLAFQGTVVVRRGQNASVFAKSASTRGDASANLPDARDAMHEVAHRFTPQGLAAPFFTLLPRMQGPGPRLEVSGLGSMRRGRGGRGLIPLRGLTLTRAADREKIFQESSGPESRGLVAEYWDGRSVRLSLEGSSAVERRGENAGAAGSIPALPAISCADAFGDDLAIGLASLEATSLSHERGRLTRDKGGLWEFVKAAWRIVEPEQPLTENWHLAALCGVLEDVTRGLVKRLVVNVPPGTLKSLLVSVFWPAWSWAKRPGLRFLCASYGAHLSTRDNLKVRDIVTSAWFQRLFPLKLVEDQNTKTRYNTDKGGWRVATSVNGVGTGEHPDIIIIDDPTTADQAMSDADRQAANDWFDRTLSTRGITRPNLAVVVIMQRLHEEDLAGHLLKRGGCYHVRWPMRFEKCECVLKEGVTPSDLPAEERCPVHAADEHWSPDPLDERTTPGELLIPALIPEEKVRQLELDLGPYGAAGQLQQRPSPIGGGLFRLEWFKYIDLSELSQDPLVREVRGWDTAASEGKGDWTRGVKIGETASGKYVVLPPAGGQLSPANVDRLMKAVSDADDCPQREEKEGGAAGKTVIEARARTLAGADYAGVTVSGSKRTRAKPFRAQVEGGNVYLLRGAWNADYTTELCAFPTGKHDDYVDASSCAFNALLLEPRHVMRIRKALWG